MFFKSSPSGLAKIDDFASKSSHRDIESVFRVDVRSIIEPRNARGHELRVLVGNVRGPGADVS
jgi:hypothetical protein